MIRPSDLSLLDRYDALLFDLDGTVMHGARPIPGAADGVRTVRDHGVGVGFVTNNASRTPEQVVSHLAGVGVEARTTEIATSPQIAAQLLARNVPAGSTVLVLGAEGLADEIRAAGYDVVREDRPEVAAVVQGFSPDLGWAQLAEGAYALGHGATWVATNTDATLPTERGLAPGNGSLVQMLQHATGRTPSVAGKPAPEMFRIAASSLAADRPLVVGDRLDTDIEGANRAGMASLLVLTGVDDTARALVAPAVRRPTWVLPDLSTLASRLPDAVVEDRTARCGAVSAHLDGEDLHLDGPVTDPRTVRAALALLAATHPDTALGGQVVAQDGPTPATGVAGS